MKLKKLSLIVPPLLAVPSVMADYNITLMPSGLFNQEAFSGTSGMLLIMFFIIVLGLMIFMGEHFRIPFFLMLAGIYSVFFGMLIYSILSAVIGTFVVFTGIFFLFRMGYMCKR